MKAMEAKGFSQKEALNLKEETSKLADLDYLKKQKPIGPFTSSNEVSSYLLNEEIDEDTKNKRLYIEVRYARKTSLSLKPTASVFRLKKQYVNLSCEEYGENLISYLDDSKSCTTLTMRDLKNVLHALSVCDNNTVEGAQPLACSDNSDQTVSLDIGEHVSAFWCDDFGKLEWFLAIVDGPTENNKVSLSYMKKSRKTKSEWVFPEDSEIRETSLEQIILSKISVNYFCSIRVRCIIPDDTVSKIDAALKEKMP